MQDLNWITDRLSNQVRTVALGVLAFSWGLLLGDSAMVGCSRDQLLLVGMLAVGVMFCDFLQYACGYHNSLRLYRSMEQSGADSGQYPEDFFYWGRKVCFSAKQWLALASVLWLGYVVVGLLG